MKKRETPQALMVLWLQAGPAPCRWRLMQARLARSTPAPTLSASTWTDRYSPDCERRAVPTPASAR